MLFDFDLFFNVRALIVISDAKTRVPSLSQVVFTSDPPL